MINKIFFLVIVIATFLNCSSCDTHQGHKKQEDVRKCTLNIDSVHFMVADIKNGLVQYLYNDSIYQMGNSYSIFNKEGQILSTECKTKYNEVLINEFHDGQIFRSSKYVWDSSIMDYRPQELLIYRDGLIDKNEGNFVDVNITKKDDNFVEFTVNFNSAFNFVNGELLFGREIEDYSDEKDLSKLSFNENNSHFRIEKSKIIFGADSSFHCLVKITTDSLARSKYIQRTFSEETWTSNFLIRKDSR